MDKIIDKNNSTGAVSIRRVIIMGGAFIGLLIGSGFTTGQEIMQYFVAWGYGGYAAVAMMFILFCYVGISFVTVGAEQKFEEPKNIYQYYCGKYIGNFFDWFSVVFLFMSFWVMTAGAGAAFNQSFGWPTWMGGTLMGTVTIITLFFGFNKLVDIVGSIGPVVSVLAICLGIAGIMMNPEGLSTFAEQVKPLVADGTVKAAGENWFLSCASYVGFCMFWLAVFMTNMGSTANSKKEAIYGTVFGASLYSLAVLVLMFGLGSNLAEVAGVQIPTLIIAKKISPALAIVYTLIVFTEIYTTAGPLLWTPVKRIASDEKSNRYRIALVVLGVIGVIVGINVDFASLINVVYVINGYVGFILLFAMIITDVRVRILKNHTPAIVTELKNKSK